MTVSRFIDLRSPSVAWSSPRDSLPERISVSSEESLERIVLPNASLCADFLVTPENIWAGVTVGVAENNFQRVAAMFSECSPNLVRVISPQDATHLRRYQSYRGIAWIEVCWLEAVHINMVEVQVNEVLWYARRIPQKDIPLIGIMALENIPVLVQEPESILTLPPDWE